MRPSGRAADAMRDVSITPGFARHAEGSCLIRVGATEVLCVPTMSVALLEHPDPATRDLSSLFSLLSGAAPAPVWLWEKLRDELRTRETDMGDIGGLYILDKMEEESFARRLFKVTKVSL